MSRGKAILCVICEGICLQIHSGYIFTLRFALDHLPLSSQIRPSTEMWHSFSYCLMQINLDCVFVCVCGISTQGFWYSTSPLLNEVLFFFFIRCVYHPTWSQDQSSNTFHHIKERYTDNCDNRCEAVTTPNIKFPFLFQI